jgi:hypothetical protein
MKAKYAFRFLNTALPALLLLLTMAGSASAQLSGAIFTTDASCTGVNLNHYETKRDVFVDGGPRHKGHATQLNDGSYCLQVIEPGGTVLGQSTAPVITVTGGSFATCYNVFNNVKTASSGFTQVGFDTTTNPGGEYQLVIALSTDGKTCDFSARNIIKSDNFKVRCPDLNITCPPDVNVQCPKDVPAPDITKVVVSGSCPPLTVTFVGDTNNGGKGCKDSPLIITRTYRVTDKRGKHPDCQQTSSVIDTSAGVSPSSPVRSGPDVTVQCSP